MSGDQARFVGSILQTYERVLEPFLFEYYAGDLAARLEAPAGGRVLETACGTGISTAAARAAHPATRQHALDRRHVELAEQGGRPLPQIMIAGRCKWMPMKKGKSPTTLQVSRRVVDQ